MSERKIVEFLDWLTEGEQNTKEEFEKKGYGTLRLEVSVIKEKFREIFCRKEVSSKSREEEKETERSKKTKTEN